jgi:hypothetical protein
MVNQLFLPFNCLINTMANRTFRKIKRTIYVETQRENMRIGYWRPIDQQLHIWVLKT